MQIELFPSTMYAIKRTLFRLCLQEMCQYINTSLCVLCVLHQQILMALVSLRLVVNLITVYVFPVEFKFLITT